MSKCLIADRIMLMAMSQVGTREFVGEADNPEVIKYFQAVSFKSTNDETPWCSAFANWVMGQCGIKGTGSAAARSWLDWGVSVDKPFTGCIVVLKRGSNPKSGHVTFYVSEYEKDNSYIVCLGGNQGDAVKTSIFKKSDVLGYRWVEKDK